MRKLTRVDTSVLVSAHRKETPNIDELAGSTKAQDIPMLCICELLRAVTHPRLFDPPHSAVEACAALSLPLALKLARVLRPGPGFPQHVAEALREAGAVGNLVFDAQFVAVCQEHGTVVLLTEDRDFDRFGILGGRTAGRLKRPGFIRQYAVDSSN